MAIFFILGGVSSVKMYYYCTRFPKTKSTMPTEKKRIMIAYSRLSEELEELFKQTYPKGYTDAVIPISKPNGETIYAVRLETPDTSYLVKVEVKIDTGDDDDDDSNVDFDSSSEGGNDSSDSSYDDDDNEPSDSDQYDI